MNNALCLVAVIFIIPYLAATVSGEGNEYQKAALELHNEYRKKHQVEPLKMSTELNDLAVQCAQYYAKKGTIDHSCPTKTRADGSKAGENLFMSSASNMEDVKAAKQATTKWYEEVKLYNFDADSPSNFAQVGHFTQLVWKDSKELGVGVAKGGIVVGVALYYPHGNFNNNYKENVLRAVEGDNSKEKALPPGSGEGGQRSGNDNGTASGHCLWYSPLVLFTCPITSYLITKLK